MMPADLPESSGPGGLMAFTGVQASAFIGVAWRDGLWEARTRDPATGKLKHLGAFASEVEAARKYDEFAATITGRPLNFRSPSLHPPNAKKARVKGPLEGGAVEKVGTAKKRLSDQQGMSSLLVSLSSSTSLPSRKPQLKKDVSHAAEVQVPPPVTSTTAQRISKRRGKKASKKKESLVDNRKV